MHCNGKSFIYLRQPEVKVLDAGVEVLLLVGLFQLLALLRRFVHQELPLLIQRIETGLMEAHTVRIQKLKSLLLLHYQHTVI